MMFRVKPGTRENLTRDWPAMARRQRWIDGIIMVLVLVLLWWTEWDDEVPFSPSGHWPLMMPLVLILGARLVTGLHQYGGTYYRVVALAAGDHSVVAKYPPVIQAALIRLVKAGEHEKLMPLGHRALWRMGIPFPPMAFSPWWLNALVMSVTSFMVLPFWLYLQHWWNPEFGGGELNNGAGALTAILLLLMPVFALAEGDGPKRLNLPRWSRFRKDWRLRRR